ncbi:MAG TPA: M48 family metallopeptidase [Pyrinomonadaceae bacterium]|nr:M48 family metallopeptidase [Pyrinomonadaceae bacterium]
MDKNSYRRRAVIAWLALASIVLVPLSAFSQTKITYHSNKFKLEDDVKLGRQAAQEAERQMPILRDREATDYVGDVGRRLVAAIPAEFQHPEFSYYFKIVNASDINAFALPGGPMYLNRGMIEAARNEGEMAGVMAHELSHVALRHGTAQATKAQKYGLFANILGIGGAVLGGPIGTAAQIGAQSVGVYFLKFSREYETEADILGAQIMARANYDPQDLANMFRTIERVSGGGGGGFFSDHPSPKDRYARINQEAQYLRVSNPIKSTREFERVQSRLRGSPRAQSTSEIARNGQRYPVEGDTRNPETGRTSYPNNAPTGTVSRPSTRYRNFTELGVLRMSAPDNWAELKDGNSVWFVPEGGYGSVQGQAVFTHGINFAIGPQDRNLQQTMNEMVNNWLQGNRNMRQIGRVVGSNTGRRYWLSTRFRNRNEATNVQEDIALFATQLSNGNVLFISTVVPQNESAEFQEAINRIMNSLQISD